MFREKLPPFEGGEAGLNFRWLRGQILPLSTVVPIGPAPTIDGTSGSACPRCLANQASHMLLCTLGSLISAPIDLHIP
jgi:hypothetical protein